MINDINNAFSKVGDNVNLEVDGLSVGCVTSKNNKFSLDSSGNLYVKTITETSRSDEVTLDDIYPVGSIYITFSSAHPNNIFNVNWNWQQIQNCFLLGCSGTRANGTTGGEENVHLEDYHLPSHTHTIGWDGGHSHYANFLEVLRRIAGLNSNNVARPVGSSSDSTGTINTSYGEHGHTMENTGNIYNSHNNMPPYLAVYVWKRVESVNS